MRRAPAAALAALLLAGCSAPRESEAEAAPEIGFERASADAGVHGERLARVLGCRGCHGEDLTGHAWFEDPQVALLFSSNLTRTVPRYDDAGLARAVREGVRPDGSALWAMPSDIFTDLGEADMAALIAHLRTVPPAGEDHPRIRIGPEGRRMIEASEVKAAPAYVAESRGRGPPAVAAGDEWARYMIRATCSECHGIDLTGDPQTEDRPAPDLDIVGAYSLEQFRHLMRTGEPPGGRPLRLMSEVSRGRFAHLTLREVDAIHFYLAARAERRR